MPTVDGQPHAFTAAYAAEVMEAACSSVGLDHDGARLLRLGENALFQLRDDPVVVRIARSSANLLSARKEVAVSRWLTGEGFPVVRLVEEFEQPLLVDNCPVTIWHRIEGATKPDYGDLGRVLSRLHGLSVPDELTLPRYDALGKVDLRIERAPIPQEDRLWLRKRCAELRDQIAGLPFASARGPIHGDAHIQNLLVDRAGQVVMIDLEAFCWDHAEWDLMVTATEYARLGWQTSDQYAAFTVAYGRDLREWPGFETLAGLQELRMTTWLSQNLGESAEIAREYEHRMASLRDEGLPRHWRPT